MYTRVIRGTKRLWKLRSCKLAFGYFAFTERTSMGTFRYITEKGASPNGKLRVYLCSHRSEIHEYLDQILSLISAKHPDAALWYYDEEAEGEDEVGSDSYYEKLSEMRLFVVLVTEKFLEGGHPALEVDFRYANERKTPALILLQKPDEVDRFNEVCGKLHLIKLSDDDSEEKAEQFLSFLLADRALMDRIKHSFDAQTFLSYRKVDRKYAKQLMDLIHRSYRGLAIWFDDYLTSGEEFDVEIMDALEHSDFMTLVVTPNVLKKPNYVEYQEYPQARDVYHKKVIPVEMEQTDRDQLSHVLEDLDECIDISDEEKLIVSILDEVDKYRGRNNLDKEEKDYLIGLAYLMGIHVERDPELGFKMIEGSAEAGKREAMDKLYQMYRVGDYVERDYKKAIIYKRKQLESLWTLLSEIEDDEERVRYSLEFINGSLELIEYQNQILNGECYYESVDDVYSIDGTRQIEGYAYSLSRHLNENYPTVETYIAFINCHLLLVGIKAKRNEDILDEIERDYSDIIATLSEIYADNLDAKLLLGKIHFLICELCRGWLEQTASEPKRIKREVKERFNYYVRVGKENAEAAVRVYEELYNSDHSSLGISRRLCRAYSSLAKICSISWRIREKEKHRQAGREYYFKAIELAKQIMAEREKMGGERMLEKLYLDILLLGGGAVFDEDERERIADENMLLQNRKRHRI